MVCSIRGRKGKKSQQRKGKDSPTESPTSEKDGFKFDENTKASIMNLA